MGLLRIAARTAVISGTATAVSGRVAQRQAGPHQQRLAADAAAPPVQGTPGDTPADRLAAVERLASLNKQGLLTDAEFRAATAQILGI